MQPCEMPLIRTCSTCTQCYPGSVLPAAAGEPLLDLIEAVGAPEGLVVDDDIGRAERAAADGLVHLVFHQILDRRIVERGANLFRLQPELGAHGDGVLRVGDVDVIDKISAIQGGGERLRLIRVFPGQPVESARRRLRGYRESGRQLELYA